MIGSVIDARYEILERISEGTFFTVFKARDRVLNRVVTVKTLSARYAGNQEFVGRLRSELQAVSGLTHAGIARVFEVGDFEGVVYIAMEYVRGTDLKERIRRSAPLPLSDAVSLTIRIAQALDYAHRAGDVHGDVTPQNVLVTPELDVKLTDFGVARAASASSLAHSNALLRGVHYLAPEVAEGREATPAADTYALGVILYEMLTGSVPFGGDTPLAVALKHAQEQPPSPKLANPSVPRAIEGVIAKALAKDPAQRYPTALAMMRDLRRAEECIRLGRPLSWSPLDDAPASANEPTQVAAEPRRKRDGWRVITTMLLFLVVILTAGIAAFFFTGLGLPKDVVVPEIVGKPRTEAEALLQQSQLTMKVVQQQHSDQYPADTIIYAVPEAGRQVTEGREIRVTLSEGPEQVAVPDVMHTTLKEARRVLGEAGLQVGQLREEQNDVVPKGQIVGQDPRPEAQAARGSKVDLTVSQGALEPASTPPPATDVEPDQPDQPAQADAPKPDAPKPARPPKRSDPQRWEVSVEVPVGPAQQRVRIVVQEGDQEKEVYNAPHASGENFSTTVETNGAANIRVFIDDRLIREEQVGTPE